MSIESKNIYILSTEKSIFSRAPQLIRWFEAAINSQKILNVEGYGRYGRYTSYLLCGMRCIKLLTSKNNIVILTFGSKLCGFIFIFWPLIKILKRGIFVYDYGYSFSDIPGHSWWKNSLITWLDKKIIKCADYVLCESDECIYKESYINSNAKWLVFYSIDYDFVVSSGQLDHHFNDIENIKSLNILFRGNLNRESGIIEWLNILLPILISDESIHLTVIGNGYYLNKVEEISSHHKNIKILSDFLQFDDLKIEISRADIMLGQYGLNYARLDTTIPHKFFEAIFNNVPYLSPETKPVLKILGSEWLVINNFLLNKIIGKKANFSDFVTYTERFRYYSNLNNYKDKLIVRNYNTISGIIND